MSSYARLKVGEFVVCEIREAVSNELLTIFRDDMLVRESMTLTEWDPELKVTDDEGAEVVEVLQFRVPGDVAVQRLNVLGITRDFIASVFEWCIHGEGRSRHDDFSLPIPSEIQEFWDAEDTALDDLTLESWVHQMVEVSRSESLTNKASGWPAEIGSLNWLAGQIEYWPPVEALRLALMAFPEAEVRLDVTDLFEDGSSDESPETLASGAARNLRLASANFVPIIVVTEGKSDAVFLSDALGLLYPHLTDIVKFLDYDDRPEGGAGALVRTIRSFAAAGIINRVVAIFDNDTAAAEALLGVDRIELPKNIVVTRYPYFEALRNYPTLGPPTRVHPTGTRINADVNGLAASIELYLGKDVLTDPDGQLQPVQWISYSQGTRRYQGQVLNKAAVQQQFREKVARCRRAPDEIEISDWSGLRLIVEEIMSKSPRQVWPL